MKFRSSARLAPALLALFLVALFVAEARTQQRRRPSRRATNPVSARDVLPAPTPLAQEPTVVRTAEDVQDYETPPRRRTTSRNQRRTAEEAEQQRQEELRATVNKLSDSVTKITEDLTEMKGEQRVLIDLERLTRAEQRAEGLRAQLRDVTDKEFVLQDRLAQIEAELEPEAIQRRSALIGSLNPATVREQIRLSLEREKARVQRQLELLSTSRVRLESAVASADQEVERIKARIDAVEQQQTREAEATNNQTVLPAPPPASTPPAEPPRE
jgi:chromosome segregation ATPase